MSNSLWQFIASIFIVVVLAIAYLAYRVENLKEWAKTRTGKGILKGIILATLFTVLFAAIGFSRSATAGDYFNDASVFFGLDHTKKLSPMCEDEGPDSRTTSNMGLNLNLYRSDDKRFQVGTKYTHHSCAFSPDNRQYDALGFVVEYKFWQR